MTIKRIDTNTRMSQIVIHNGTAYFAGQVALKTPGQSAKIQTIAILDQIDALLSQIDCDKTDILSATIWLSDMADFAAMNSVWDAWVPENNAPTRACVESRLATPDFNVEIVIIVACSA